MSLDTVVADIKDEARARAEDIRAEAEADAEKVVAEAEREAEEIREQRLREAERQIEQEREQKLSSAKLEAKQERLEARRDVLEEVREKAEAAIAELEDGREELTRVQVENAAEEFSEGDQVSIYGRSEDEELLRSILEEYDGFSYAGEYDCLGGIVAESESSRVRIKNTFDTIHDQVWEGNLREISDRLFEDQ